MSNLGKSLVRSFVTVLLLCLVICSSGCSFEKLNFTVDKGLLDPSSPTVDAAKVAPTVIK